MAAPLGRAHPPPLHHAPLHVVEVGVPADAPLEVVEHFLHVIPVQASRGHHVGDAADVPG